jgi:hypothetical protein
MAKWTDYTTDTNPTDTDEVMALDADKSPKANKRVTLSTLADYFLDKLASKVFAKLETQNQTVIGALNELNSKQFSIINLSKEFTSTNGNYAYTGLSITIPEYTMCLISISISWMNAMPIGVILNSSDSECSNSTMAFEFEGYPTVATYITEPQNKSRTYYVWAKCEGIGVNRASIFGCSCKTK